MENRKEMERSAGAVVASILKMNGIEEKKEVDFSDPKQIEEDYIVIKKKMDEIKNYRLAIKNLQPMNDIN